MAVLTRVGASHSRGFISAPQKCDNFLLHSPYVSLWLLQYNNYWAISFCNFTNFFLGSGKNKLYSDKNRFSGYSIVHTRQIIRKSARAEGSYGCAKRTMGGWPKWTARPDAGEIWIGRDSFQGVNLLCQVGLEGPRIRVTECTALLFSLTAK